MCGFAAEIRFDGQSANVDAVSRMAEVLAPRGPDGDGLFSQGRIAVGHRRLRVMDRTEHSQQPMLDPQLGLGIVFNGAIYNHPELRAELKSQGYTFYSEGDTEVILKAYDHWGAHCVDHFHGMFAFVIWERDSGRVFMGRDRLGIKPLYTAEIKGGLRVASTLPALLAGGGLSREIDPVALHHYLHFHAVVPAPHTILKAVRKLSPATVRTVETDGNSKDHVYWQLDFSPQAGDAQRSEGEWIDAVLGATRKAVHRRLVADEPVGALLSGGVDSSLIVGLMAEQGANLKTYSIGFEDVGEEKGNEFEYSDCVAQAFATDHHQIRIDSNNLLGRLPEAITAMSEPMVSHDCVAFFLLSEAVSRHSKVVQSGQGADEVFGGYHWYPPMLASRNGPADYAKGFCDRSHEDYRALVQAPHLSAEDVSRAFIAEQFGLPGATRPVDQALRLDTTIMLVDDPVKRVDNMTMAWGLEARVPFLDHELVELAARIPAELKLAPHLGEAGGKYVLKEAARKVVPAKVIDRPKGYFPVPALKYLRGEFLEQTRGWLTNAAARQRGLFNDAAVQTLLADPEAHLTPLRGSKVWQLALLEAWLQTHFDGAA
ncbi:N-acetylglutaminylglutamine amidotransferase [Polycyclovorans algicola]|uniref:N-acetylglutaminylglutamine amidotransferase n=1 Tax=Polycyclovorans algicola TaxID=616992 RepID=UPI0004A70AE9|nr:N-acetylglutaminylglutamine amidotransferase [Polycyclovorans algicola]